MSQQASGDAKSTRLPSLDLARFLSAFAVMLYHFLGLSVSATSTGQSTVELITQHGYLGIYVFFILSGFVIIWSTQGRSPTDFVRARLLRLYPEFWVAVVVTAAILWLVSGHGGYRPSPTTVLVNLTMVPQLFGVRYVDVVYWTLFFELKFYLLIWLLMLFGWLRHIELVLIGIVALNALGLWVELPRAVSSVTLMPHGVMFATGGLFYQVYRNGWTTRLMAALAVALPATIVVAWRRMSAFMPESHITTSAEVATAIIIVLAFIYFGTLRNVTAMGLQGRAVATLGALTYPLYLLHGTGKSLFLGAKVVDGPFPLQVTVAVVYSLLIAYAVMQLSARTTAPALRALLDRVLPSKSPRRERPA